MILKNSKKGFSILEIIFAVGIISVSFVGLMSLFAYNLRMEILTRDRIKAVYLAQEGIEITKQMRDNDWFEGVIWPGNIPVGVSDKIVSVNNPDKIYDGMVVEDAISEDKKKVYLYNGQYVQSNGSPGAGWGETNFTRHLEITSIITTSGAQALKIVSKVNYDEGEVELVSYIYNGWY